MEQQVEIIDADELGKRWSLPVSWIREYSRSRCATPIPALRFGRYIRFSWGSKELTDWLEKRRTKVAR